MKKDVARQSLVAFVAILLAAIVTPIIRHIAQPVRHLPLEMLLLKPHGAPDNEHAIVLRRRP